MLHGISFQIINIYSISCQNRASEYMITCGSEFNLCSISFILEDEYDSDVSSANNRKRRVI
jgi:hypothetical protein